MEKESPFSKVDQVGIIVKDLDEAIKHYGRFFGPFHSRNADYQSRVLRGKSLPNDAVLIRKALGQAGAMQIELIQPVAEGTHWMDYLKKEGPGIDHLGFFVDNLEVEEARMIEMGFQVIYKSTVKHADGSTGKATYFDTGKVGGVCFELIEHPPKVGAAPH